jgi:hypothetical protein
MTFLARYLNLRWNLFHESQPLPVYHDAAASKRLANGRVPITRLPDEKTNTALPEGCQTCRMPIESVKQGARQLLLLCGAPAKAYRTYNP